MARIRAAALAILGIGVFGLFGAERDPLSGVFVVALGWPWTVWLDPAPEPAWPWLAAAAPLANLAVLWLACRAGRRGA